MHQTPNKLGSSNKLANFLLAYRTAPHTTTGESPSMLFMGRNIRTRLDVLKPDIRKRVEERQLNQAAKRSLNPTKQLQMGQDVIARNYRGKRKWVPGVIMAKTGPLSYQVKVAQNMVWHRHIDQLKNIDMTQNLHQDQEELAQAATTSENAPCDIDDSTQESPSSNLQRPERTTTTEIGSTTTNTTPVALGTHPTTGQNADQLKRYPIRDRKPPERLNV